MRNKTLSYPGLRTALTTLFAKHPTVEYSLAEVLHEIHLQSVFKSATKEIVRYHIGEMRKQKIVVDTKRGVYKLDPTYESVEDKRKRVEEHTKNRGLLVSVGSPTGFFPSADGSVVDTRYLDTLERSLRLIKQRMRSTLPANSIFYPEDEELIDALHTELLGAIASDLQKQVLRRRAQNGSTQPNAVGVHNN